jgi:hypothetical protein
MTRTFKLLSVAVLTTLALAGCGSSGSGSSALDAALSYFPASSPLIVSVATDPNSQAIKGAQALENKFPFASLGTAAGKSKLQQIGINYDADIKPLLGNPIVFGATGTTVNRSLGRQFLVAWVTKDQDKLKALLKKVPGLRSSGTQNGATLYSLGSQAVLAVNGATMLVAPSAGDIQAAFGRHAHASTSAHAPSSLAQNSVVNVFGDISGLLSAPSAAKARSIPWVAALRSYATSITASSSGLSFSYRIDTTGRSLTSAQIPIAPGSSTAQFAGNLPITVSVVNPAHVLAFAESVEQTANPAKYQQFLTRQAALKAKTGVDLNSLFALLSGDLIFNTDRKTFLARVGVSDGSAAASDLAKLATAPEGLFTTPTQVRSLGGGFYSVAMGGTTATVGVAGNQLLLGWNKSGGVAPSDLQAYGSAPATPAGGKGAVAFRINLQSLLGSLVGNSMPSVAQSALKMLGALTGTTSATSSALTGQASLAVS